jgi:hypothetical protein
MQIGSGYSSSSNYDSSSSNGSEQKTLKFTNISPKKGVIGRPESKNSRQSSNKRRLSRKTSFENIGSFNNSKKRNDLKKSRSNIILTPQNFQTKVKQTELSDNSLDRAQTVVIPQQAAPDNTKLITSMRNIFNRKFDALQKENKDLKNNIEELIQIQI